jgi:hypothetical protein
MVGQISCVRDSDRSVDDGSSSGFKAFVIRRCDYGSSLVISFLAMAAVERSQAYLERAF